MGCDIHCWAEVRNGTGVPTGEGLDLPVNDVISEIRPLQGDLSAVMAFINRLKRPLDPMIIQYLDELFGKSWRTWECTAEPEVHEYSTETWVDLPYIYDGRNYYLFALLADVRNYSGEIIPFRKPRGLPEDLSKILRDQNEEWDSDGHSHSYFMLSELLSFDWGPYRDWCRDFIEGTIPALQALGDPDDVRFVFWFDN
jgi:hypothetical protein